MYSNFALKFVFLSCFKRCILFERQTLTHRYAGEEKKNLPSTSLFFKGLLMITSWANLKARSIEQPVGLPCEWQGPKHMSHLRPVGCIRKTLIRSRENTIQTIISIRDVVLFYMLFKTKSHRGRSRASSSIDGFTPQTSKL